MLTKRENVKIGPKTKNKKICGISIIKSRSLNFISVERRGRRNILSPLTSS